MTSSLDQPFSFVLISRKGRSLDVLFNSLENYHDINHNLKQEILFNTDFFQSTMLMTHETD